MKPIILIQHIGSKKGGWNVHFVISYLSKREWEEARKYGINVATPEEHTKLEEEIKSSRKFLGRDELEEIIGERGYEVWTRQKFVRKLNKIKKDMRRRVV